jgi:hypothetical protein
MRNSTAHSRLLRHVDVRTERSFRVNKSFRRAWLALVIQLPHVLVCRSASFFIDSLALRRLLQPSNTSLLQSFRLPRDVAHLVLLQQFLEDEITVSQTPEEAACHVGQWGFEWRVGGEDWEARRVAVEDEDYAAKDHDAVRDASVKVPEEFDEADSE